MKRESNLRMYELNTHHLWDIIILLGSVGTKVANIKVSWPFIFRFFTSFQKNYVGIRTTEIWPDLDANPEIQNTCLWLRACKTKL